MKQVREFRVSRMSRTEFCRERGYSSESLRLWEKRLSEGSADENKAHRARPRFAAVAQLAPAAQAPAAATTPSVRMRLPMGVELDAHQLPSAQWVADVLLCLRQGVTS